MSFTFNSESTDVINYLSTNYRKFKLDQILNKPFQNPVDLYEIAPNRRKTLHSVDINKQTKLLWINNNTTNQVHLLGVYEGVTILTKISGGNGPDSIDIQSNRKDPATTSPGYEDHQCIGEPSFTITLNRDHIIPYKDVIAFVNTILDCDNNPEIKINNWIISALETYELNQGREKNKIFTKAAEYITKEIKGSTSLYKSIFGNYQTTSTLYKKIFTKIRKDPTSEKDQIKTLLEYYYTTNESAKIELNEDATNKLKKIIQELSSAQGLTKEQYLPSDFFTDNEGIYINVDSVKKNYKENTLSINDEIAIKRATGWMPGNVFLAPKPKPQDGGDKFDGTVAASVLNTCDILKNHLDAYNNIGTFLKENNVEAAKTAIKNLEVIARREIFRPFISENWLYDNKGNYYAKKFFDINDKKVKETFLTLSEEFLRAHLNLSK